MTYSAARTAQETRLRDYKVPPLQGGDRCGKSTNFWEYYEADIERAVSLNSTCFRLSLGAPPLPVCSACSGNKVYCLWA